MGIAMVTLSLFAWLGIWVPFAIFVLLPAVVVALLVAVALAMRLFSARNRRGIVAVVLALDLLHAALLAWAFVRVATERSDSTSTESADFDDDD
jgi:hypothetical protein